MSRLRFALLALALSMPAVVQLSDDARGDEPTMAIRVVEVQTIMREASAAKSIQAQLEQRRSQYQAELSAEESRLREQEAELARQRSVLTAEVYAQRRREFESEVAAVQRTVQERRRDLDRAYAGGVRQLQTEISQIISELAEEHGFALVLPDTQTLFVDDELSISSEVLAQLDERLPEITLEFPSE